MSDLVRSWQAHGLDCAVLYHDGVLGGHHCGYVRVPDDHPYHGIAYNADAPNPKPLEAFSDRSLDDGGLGLMISLFGGEDSVREFIAKVEGQVGVHGGLTFSDDLAARGFDVTPGWWFGFDCAHADDTLDEWTEDKTAEETEKLAAQLAAVAEEAVASDA